MNDRNDDDKPHGNMENEQISKDEALLSKALVNTKDLNYTSPPELKKLSTSLFSRMRELLANNW